MKSKLLAGLLLIMSRACAESVSTVALVQPVKSLTIKGNPVRVELSSGNVKPELRITKSSNLQVDVRQQAGNLTITTQMPPVCIGNCTAEIIVRLPAANRIAINLESGDFKLNNFTGRADISLGSGDLTVNNVRLTGSRITLDAGNFMGGSLGGELDITTNIGNIALKKLALTGKSSLTTDAGQIQLGELAFARETKITSRLGNISIDNVAGAFQSITAQTNLGEASFFRQGKKTRQGQYFVVSSGKAAGPSLFVKNDVGNIVIKQASQ